MFESLETRRHMSVTAADVHDTLYVWGDQYSNGISVDQSGSNLLVKVYENGSYQTKFSFLASAVDSVRIYGYDGNDTLQVSDNVTKPITIMGGRGADWIKGGGGTSTLYGHGNWGADPTGSHNPATDDNAVDTLVNGAGSTQMHGQGGNDSFHLNGSHAGKTDVAWGGNGNDTFHLNGTRIAALLGEGGGDTFKINNKNAQAGIMGGSHNDTIDFANFGAAVHAKNDGVTPSGVRSTPVDRKLSINSEVETIKGTDYSDYLFGNDGANNFFGRDGNDYIFGYGGQDFVDGGEGNDSVYAGSGNDTIFGQDGNDSLRGEAGNDIIFGHNGNDSLEGSDGNDTIYGGNGNDLIKGGNHNDALYGEAGSDWIYGDSGANLLVGGADSDFLVSKNGHKYDNVFGDNIDGTGSFGAFDIALVDGIFQLGLFHTDNVFGVESISY